MLIEKKIQMSGSLRVKVHTVGESEHQKHPIHTDESVNVA